MKPKPISDRIYGGLRGILLLSVCLVTPLAHADIYGYVDAIGETHFSTEKLDARYQLFLKGDGVFDSSTVAHVVAVPPRSPLLQALTRHPNLRKYRPLLTATAKEFQIDPALMMAMMAAESGFNPAAVSPKGAIGLMQVMPATAERYGLTGDARSSIQQKLSNPAINLRLAARYLRDLTTLFPNQQALVIASYNAGEHAVQRYKNTVPPFAETRNYVQLVSQLYHFYAPADAVLARQQDAKPLSPGRIHLTIPGREAASPPQTSLN